MDLEEVLYIHYRVIEDFGGLHGVSNKQRLLSAVQKLNDPTLSQISKSATLIRDIIKDHPFADGNKRTAISVAAIYLSRMGFTLTCSPKQLEDFAIDIATNSYEPSQIANWLLQNATKSTPN